MSSSAKPLTRATRKVRWTSEFIEARFAFIVYDPPCGFVEIRFIDGGWRLYYYDSVSIGRWA